MRRQVMKQSTFQISTKSGNARLKAALKSDEDFIDKISDADVFADIAINLHRLRKTAGIRQKDLAGALCVQQSNISRYESPGYTGYTIKMLLKYVRKLNGKLNVSIEPPTADIYMHMSFPMGDTGPRPITFINRDGSYATKHARIITEVKQTLSITNAKGATHYGQAKSIQ